MRWTPTGSSTSPVPAPSTPQWASASRPPSSPTAGDITIGRYLELLAARRLHEVVPEPGHLTDDHQQILAATWELSVEQADRTRPAGLARPLLQLASVLDPAGLPQQVLASPPALAYLIAALATTAEAADEVDEVDQATVDEALRVLYRYNLIDHERSSSFR